MENIKLGERLSELMLEHNKNAAALADAIDVNVTTIRSWMRGAKLMSLPQIIKLADYFNCSLDYLVGRTDKVIDFIPQKECPPFYSHLMNLLQDKDISRNKVNIETRIKSSYFVEWNKGGNPHILSLIELADYLDISLDELIGRVK